MILSIIYCHKHKMLVETEDNRIFRLKDTIGTTFNKFKDKKKLFIKDSILNKGYFGIKDLTIKE